MVRTPRVGGRGRVVALVLVAALAIGVPVVDHVVGRSGAAAVTATTTFTARVPDPGPNQTFGPWGTANLLNEVIRAGRMWTVIYGPSSAHKADFYRPDPATVPVGGSPVIVFLHGGGWIIGNRSNIDYGATTGPIVQMLRDGWTVISADYRLANATTPAPAQIPPDPQDLGRPMTDDEKIDEALLESMDASDPPAIGAPTRVGSPKQRKSPPVEETVKKQIGRAHV